MARRGKASRVSRVVKQPTPIPTPIHSAFATPISSAYPSAYPSEDESYKKPAVKSSRSKRCKPFRFMDLPPELRLRVYKYYFANGGDAVDLDPDNHVRIGKAMALFKTCRAIYSEAANFFYHNRTFRIFPCHPGKYFRSKRPLLARLTPEQRSVISSLELRLGPGWNKPPRGWVVNDALGLRDCASVRKLQVFVECDPSDGMFKGFRAADGFYEGFCREILRDVLAQLPSVRTIEFDAWPSVEKSGDMMRGLIDVVTALRVPIRWGPLRGWTDEDQEDDMEFNMARLSVGQPVLANTFAGILA